MAEISITVGQRPSFPSSPVRCATFHQPLGITVRSCDWLQPQAYMEPYVNVLHLVSLSGMWLDSAGAFSPMLIHSWTPKVVGISSGLACLLTFLLPFISRLESLNPPLSPLGCDVVSDGGRNHSRYPVKSNHPWSYREYIEWTANSGSWTLFCHCSTLLASSGTTFTGQVGNAKPWATELLPREMYHSQVMDETVVNHLTLP